MGIVVGVDTHKSSLTAAAVDELGVCRAHRCWANDPEGHDGFARWAIELDTERIGIECSGSYGAALARSLLVADHHVVEVPAVMSHREAKRQPSKGKSDLDDAVAIARVTARETTLAVFTFDQTSEDLRLVKGHRDELQRERTKLLNRLHKDLVVVAPGYEQKVPNLTRKTAMSDILKLLRGIHSVRATLMRDRVAEVRRIEARVRKFDVDIHKMLRASGTNLMQICGVGPVVAATILGEVGDVLRFRSKAAFAMFCGVAPIPASSGKTSRHRLNRGGNRDLNRALYHVAIVQSRSGRGRDYVQKKIAEGKSFKEAIRCLKRQLANAVYAQLVADRMAA